MADKNVKHRYFLIEGEHAAPIISETYRRLKERDKAAKAFVERHGTTEAFFGRSGDVVGLAFEEQGSRDGLRLAPAWEIEGRYRYVPHRGTKKGRQIAEEMKALPAFSPHSFLLKELHAYRGVPGEYVSGAGFRFYESGAGIYGDVIALHVPQSVDASPENLSESRKPFEPPAHFREIKESEFIAITKEGALP